MPGWRLVRLFSCRSLGSISLMAVILGWVTTSYLTRSMLEREQTITADYIQRVVQERMSPAELEAARHLRGESQALRRVAEALWMLPEAVRIKIYDPDGTIMWSDMPDLIGKNFRKDPLVHRSLAGHTVVELEQIASTPEHRFEHPNYKELTSIYVPIRHAQTSEVLAVFELYKYPLRLYTAIRQGRLVLWGVVLTSAGLLFLGQFGLVRGAARTINKQYSDLRNHANAVEQINVRLQDLQAQLLEAERLAALGEVTAAVAHGFRNPLGNIRLVAQEMGETLDATHQLRKPLGEIIEQVDILEARLRSFLDTVKPFTLSPSTLQLSTVIENALEGMRQRFLTSDSRVFLELEAGQTLLHCDAIKLEEAFQALLTNSVEAGAQTIRIVATATGAEVRVDIIDDGSGLPPDDSSRVWEPFFTTKALGTGLGLAIAKKIVVAHGGRLALATQALQNTVATIWLPSQGRLSKE